MNAQMIIFSRKIIKLNKKLIIIISLCLLICSCANQHWNKLGLCPLIFINISNGEDTCLICTDPCSLYYELNIKCMSQRDFNKSIGRIIEKKQVMVVSDSYFLARQDDTITYDAIADSIYMQYGLKGLEDYVEKKSLILAEGDKDTFLWAAYILWNNNMWIAVSDEDASWYIERL